MLDPKDPPRDFLTEAVAILEKKTIRIVQFEHLEAVAAQHTQAVANNEALCRAIAALLSHTPPEDGVYRMPIKGTTMRGMGALMPIVNVLTGIDPDDKDSLLITMKYARPLTVAGPKRVQ